MALTTVFFESNASPTSLPTYYPTTSSSNETIGALHGVNTKIADIGNNPYQQDYWFLVWSI